MTHSYITRIIITSRRPSHKNGLIKSRLFHQVISTLSNKTFNVKASYAKSHSRNYLTIMIIFPIILRAFQKCQHEKPIKVFKYFPFNAIGWICFAEAYGCSDWLGMCVSSGVLARFRSVVGKFPARYSVVLKLRSEVMSV